MLEEIDLNHALFLNCTNRLRDDEPAEAIEWRRFTMLPTDFPESHEYTTVAKDFQVIDAFRSKYELQGEFDLIIKNPELSDAGSYGCWSFRSANNQIVDRGNAELLITGKHRPDIHFMTPTGVASVVAAAN